MTSTHRAIGFINVTSYKPAPSGEADVAVVSLVEVVEDFTGGLVGTGTAHLVMAQLADGSAHFTGIERFTGMLAERSGSFLLRNSGTLVNGQLSSEWLVVPGSGTDELAGLRGHGGTRTSEGYFLDYWSE